MPNRTDAIEMTNGISLIRRLAERVPDLVVLSLLVYVFLAHIEKLEAARMRSLNEIGATCHVVQDRSTVALTEVAKTSREVRDVLVEVKLLLAQR